MKLILWGVTKLSGDIDMNMNSIYFRGSVKCIKQECVLVTQGISTSWFWFPQSGQHLVLKTDLRVTGL